LNPGRGVDPRNIQAQRHNDFTTLTFSGPDEPSSVASDELLTRVLGHLGKTAADRPKRQKTLMSHLLAPAARLPPERTWRSWLKAGSRANTPPSVTGTASPIVIRFIHRTVSSVDLLEVRLVVAPAAVGREDPCPCGSGRKYKKCCGA
jgi:SEC-C motif